MGQLATFDQRPAVAIHVVAQGVGRGVDHEDDPNGEPRKLFEIDWEVAGNVVAVVEGVDLGLLEWAIRKHIGERHTPTIQ